MVDLSKDYHPGAHIDFGMKRNKLRTNWINHDRAERANLAIKTW